MRPVYPRQPATTAKCRCLKKQFAVLQPRLRHPAEHRREVRRPIHLHALFGAGDLLRSRARAFASLTPQLPVDAMQPLRRAGHVLGVHEHSTGPQAPHDAREQVALLAVLEVVDRERGDDRVEGAVGELLAQVRDDRRHGPRRQPPLGHSEHLRSAVEHRHVRARVAREHGLPHQARSRAEVEHPLDRTRAQRDHVHGGAVEEVEAWHDPPSLAVVVRRMRREHAHRICHQMYAITYIGTPSVPVRSDVAGRRRLAGVPEHRVTILATAEPRRRRPGLPVRLAISWLTNALVLAIVAALLARVDFRDAGDLLLAAAVFGVLNTVLKPVLRLVTLPLAVVTLGVAWFFVSLLMLLLTAAIVSGFSIHGFWTLVAATAIVWLVNLALDFTPGPWQITGRRRRLRARQGRG
jgi:putative membrane protein